MMRKQLMGILAIALIGIMVTGCGKYPDGPGLSVRSKSGRLAGEWIVEKYIDEDGTEYIPTDSETYTFEKDGTFRITDGPLSINGLWEFTDKKESVRWSFDAGGTTLVSTVEILRLTNDEFWFKDEDNDKTYMKAK